MRQGEIFVMRRSLFAVLFSEEAIPPSDSPLPLGVRLYSILCIYCKFRICLRRLPPGGRDALRKYAGGIFLAKAGSKLCLRPGPKRWRSTRYNKVSANRTSRGLLPSRRLNTIRRATSLDEGGFDLNRSSRLQINKQFTVGEGHAPLAVILSGGDN